MSYIVDKYAFAIGKQIKQVFTESFLYLDGSNNMEHYEETSIKRIDMPLFLLLNDDMLLRLHGSSFSVVDGYLREYVLSDDFNSDTETQQMFQFLCDRTIIDVQEYRIYYDYEDKDNNIKNNL